MSRSATRARRRRALIEAELTEHRDRVAGAPDPEKRAEAMGALIAALKRIAESGVALWPVAVRVFELDRPGEEADALNAIVAQLVAPHLAGTTPGSVRRRLRCGETVPVSVSQSQGQHRRS